MFYEINATMKDLKNEILDILKNEYPNIQILSSEVYSDKKIEFAIQCNDKMATIEVTGKYVLDFVVVLSTGEEFIYCQTLEFETEKEILDQISKDLKRVK